MARFLIEVHLPSESRGEFRRLIRVIRSAQMRIERNSNEPRVDAMGLVSNGQRTYCVVSATSAVQVGGLMQTAMLSGRILRITELDANQGLRVNRRD